jgi:deazaflavin-dependent oxidoreductase (nitroreductase family)
VSLTRRARRPPGWIALFNRIAKPLLAAGVPMGPDVLLTVRGRRSGLPRSTPVAVAEIDGRLWLISPFGRADWVANLRAAGRATITSGRRTEQVTARELTRDEAIAYYRDVVNPYLRRTPLARWIVRNLDRIPEDPESAADATVVFEIMPA